MRLAGLLICVCVLFAQAASAADPNYTLNPGDQLVVSSFDDERLNREVVVLPDGTISYLAIGQLKAQGKTATQLEAEIAEALVQKGFLQPGSVISVSVSHGGQHDLCARTGEEPRRVFDALRRRCDAGA